MSEILSFSVDYYKVLEEDNLITLIQLKPVITGGNLHNTYFSIEAIKNAEPTLYNKPIICIWNNNTADFIEHARTLKQKEMQDCVGCIPETNDSQLLEEENGETAQYINAAIWKHYFPNVASKLNSNGTTKISMEISVEKSHKRDDGFLEIDEYKYVGFTLLGENIVEAIPNANAKIIKYSTSDYSEMVDTTNKQLMQFSIPDSIKENTNKFLKLIEGDSQLISFAKEIIENDSLSYSKINGILNTIHNVSEDNIILFGGIDTKNWCEEVIRQFSDNEVKIEIDNTKETSVSGKWENPENDLYAPILKASNKGELINEAYLIHEEGYEDNPSEKLKYPHHVIKEGKLVLHFIGVQAAFQRARQEALTGEPIDHLKRHYEELGLNTDNFSEFNLTLEDYKYLFSEKEEKEQVNNEVIEFSLNSDQIREILRNALSEYKYISGIYEHNKYYVDCYDAEYVYVYDWEDEKEYRMTYQITDNIATVDVKSAQQVINGGYMLVGEPSNNDIEIQLQEMSLKYDEACQKYSILEQETVEKYALLEELQQFKVNTEKAGLETKANELYSKYENYLTDEEKTDLNLKLFSVDSFDLFTEKVFSIVFPKIEAENIALKESNKNTEDDPNKIQFSAMPLLDSFVKDENKSSLDKLREYVNS